MPFSEIVTIVKDVIAGLATVAAVIAAFMGLNTWKHQLRGNTNYKVSRRVLRATFRFREAIRYVRRPLITAGEMAAARKAAGLTDEMPSTGADTESEALAYQARWKAVGETRADFDAVLLEAEALWGSEIQARADLLRKCEVELHTSLGLWLTRTKRALEPKTQDQIFGVIYEGISPDYANRLDDALRGIEEIARKYLKL